MLTAVWQDWGFSGITVIKNVYVKQKILIFIIPNLAKRQNVTTHYMTRHKTIIILLFGHFLFSYGQRPYKDKPQHSDWETLKLLDNWTLQAPRNFKDSTILAIDNHGGYIYSTKDNIRLEFTSGHDRGNLQPHIIGHKLKKPDCNFRKQVERKKKDAVTYYIPFLNGNYGVVHVFRIDTIGDRVASIITPKVVGKGVTNISVEDCPTGRYLIITGYDLTASIQNLVLEICRTIRLSTDKR